MSRSLNILDKYNYNIIYVFFINRSLITSLLDTTNQLLNFIISNTHCWVEHDDEENHHPNLIVNVNCFMSSERQSSNNIY